VSSALEEMAERAHAGKQIASDPSFVERCNAALVSLRERSTTSCEILNAGWLYKAQHLYGAANQALLGPGGSSLDHGLEQFEERIVETDDLLCKSVESAAVQRVLERP
jgi:hypothetical protein